MADSSNNNITGQQPPSPGLVTITSEAMQALDTNGTKEIVSPDSPKKGHLFVLNTKETEDGEVEIERTLVDPGEAPPETQDESTEPTDITPTPGDDNQASHLQSATVVLGAPEPLAVIEEHEAEHAEEATVDQKVQDGTEESEAEVPQDGPREPPNKPKRVMSIPVGGRFTLPWQKKQVLEDPSLEPVAENKPAATTTTTTTTTTKTAKSTVVIHPSNFMKSIKKGLKIKVGGLSRSTEDSAPGRIPQKSGSRPSPRIVSSLNITPSTQPGVAATPDSPGTQRRKELGEILKDMPPTPTMSMEDVKQASENQDQQHIYDNLPQNGTSSVETAEEAICPSVATRSALNLVSAKSEGVNGSTEPESKPPRPPPAVAKTEDNSDLRRSKSFVPRKQPPPRPTQPPRCLQKSYTMVARHPTTSDDNDIISPVSTQAVNAAPVQMRTDYASITTSLDRRKLYRSKGENRIAKRATIARPITMHETTFIVKEKPNDTMTRSFDRGRTSQKVVFEQKDSITLPKFLQGNKRKSVPAPISRPLMSPDSTNGSERSYALRSMGTTEDEVVVSPVATTQQCFAAPPKRPEVVSISVQTAPQRPKTPVSSLSPTNDQPTLLTMVNKPWLSPSKEPPSTPPAAKELQIPLLGERLVRLVKEPSDAKSSLFIFRSIHRMFSMKQGDEEPASEKLVKRCLEEYMEACARIRGADLQGQFSSFHWQCGDLKEAGWYKRGVIEGTHGLEVYHDPAKEIDFVKLPPLQYKSGTLVYPKKTVDELLATWIDIGETQVKTDRSEFSTASDPVFHPLLGVLQLSSLLQELRENEQLKSSMQHNLALAVLLSISFCQAKLGGSEQQEGERLFLNLDPRQILLLCSPSNCLVLLSVTDSEGNWNIQKLLLEFCPDYADSLEVGVKGCMDEIRKSVAPKIYLPALLEAVAPPDWIMETSARVLLNKGETFSAAQDTGN